MDSKIVLLIEGGWDISIFTQKKRDDGHFVPLLQWRAKKFGGLKEYTNEGKGFSSGDEAISNMWNTLINL